MSDLVTDWSPYPNFSKREFDCKHTGRNRMRADFMAKLQALRSEFGKPMVISSGYRDPSHPVEARKSLPGTHAHGIACDIRCHGPECFEVLALALKHGFTGIGIAQKGGSRFIHLDIRRTVPTVWSY